MFSFVFSCINNVSLNVREKKYFSGFTSFKVRINCKCKFNIYASKYQ